MIREMPSIKAEMDKLDQAEAEKRRTKAGLAILKSVMQAFDGLPADDRERILREIDSSRPSIRKEDI